MGRAPCCSKLGLHRGPWTPREDILLVNYIHANGEGHWRSLPKKAGLLRCGKSCRLRWMNYLRPDIKRGNITPDEDDLIIRLHSLLGNRWSLIAGRLPGRTDNEIKNYWNSHLSKRLKNTTKEINCSTPTDPTKCNEKKKMMIKGKKNQESGNGQTSTNKIHLPKAVRVSSVSIARTSSSFNNTEVDNDLAWTWSGFDHQQQADNDLFCGYFSSSCQSYKLDEIFDEYDQLLKTDNNENLDSFIDSLLA